MKTITKIAALLILATIGSQGKAQVIMLNMCYGNPTVITAVNSQSLSSPIYSLFPGGIISPNPTFAITPTANVVYTLYCTGTNTNSIFVTTSSTIGVAPIGVNYSVVSPSGFSLSCTAPNVCTISVINASTVPIPGGPISYTFFPPGTPTFTLPTGSLGNVNWIAANLAGVWSVVVKDNISLCTSITTVNISPNNLVSPAIPGLTVTQNPLTCSNPTTLVQAATNSGVTYTWMPSGTAGNNLTVAAVTTASSVSTQSIAETLTLVVTSISNSCQSTTVIPIYQNLFPPNAGFSSGSPSTSCAPTIVLTNTSSTNVPAIFSPTALISAMLWEGPSPQPTLGFSTTYIAQTSGIYTMTALDNNNGCTKTATMSLTMKPVAAYVHTVTNGTASFSNASTNTAPNATYFWDFGDGNTSTLQNPIHTYLNGGAHLVKLKVSNPGNMWFFCGDSVIQSVAVSGIPCVANSGFSMVPTGTAQVWNVVPNYPWNITAARWDWGDGSSSNTLYTSHQYSAAGLYQICLSVTVSCIASSSTCTSYSVYRGTPDGLIVEVNVVPPALISGLSSVTDAEFSWHIAPNPNTGEFRMHVGGVKSETVRVMICDLTGRIVYDRPADINSTDITVRAENLSEGMYLVTLEAGDLKTTKRMVVNR